MRNLVHIDPRPVTAFRTEFVPIDPLNPFARPGDTHMFLGRTYKYFWNEHTHLLRRHRVFGVDPVTVKCKHIPSDSRALAQKFWAVVADRSVSVRRWRGKRPEQNVHNSVTSMLSPHYMVLAQLELVWRWLRDTPLPGRDKAACAMAVGRLLTETNKCLLNKMPPTGGGMQLAPRLWVVDPEQVPEGTRYMHEREPPLQMDMVVRLVVTANPKRRSGAAWSRWWLYRDGMSVREARAAGVQKRDLINDRRKGYITVAHEDSPI